MTYARTWAKYQSSIWLDRSILFSFLLFFVISSFFRVGGVHLPPTLHLLFCFLFLTEYFTLFSFFSFFFFFTKTQTIFYFYWMFLHGNVSSAQSASCLLLSLCLIDPRSLSLIHVSKYSFCLDQTIVKLSHLVLHSPRIPSHSLSLSFSLSLSLCMYVYLSQSPDINKSIDSNFFICISICSYLSS